MAMSTLEGGNLSQQEDGAMTPTDSMILPDDVLLYSILPWLSFKSLCRLKCTCKAWRDIISDDPVFALAQSLRPSSISSGVLCTGPDRLVFYPTLGSPIGAPNPSLIFNITTQNPKVHASTNGLLCYTQGTGTLCIVNPATGKNEIVPNKGRRSGLGFPIGLAFDPSASPDSYTLVYPVSSIWLDGKCLNIQHRFEVYSSDTREWAASSQIVGVHGFTGRYSHAGVSVFARGIVYWDFLCHILWFDPRRDVAGHTTAPPGVTSPMVQALGVWDGRVTCTRASCDGVDVWVMCCGGGGGVSWERRHRVGWDAVETGISGISASLLGGRGKMIAGGKGILWEFERDLLGIKPLPFEGGESVYVMIRWFGWQTGTCVMLSFDLETGNAASCTLLDGNWTVAIGPMVHGYHNSMAPLPNRSTLHQRI